MRKSLSKVLLCALMAVLFLAGCSNGGKNTGNDKSATGESGTPDKPANFNPSGFPIVNEKITLKLMGAKQAIEVPWDQMVFFKEMESKTNIKMEFDTPSSDSYKEKKNLMFASGQLPDLFLGGNLSSADEVIYGQQGDLIPLETLIEQYAPTIKKIMDADPDIRKSITAPDGHIYALPQMKPVFRDQITRVFFNGEWLEKSGKPVPSTTEELYDLLVEFKNNDMNGNGKQDEIPLSMLNLKSLRMVFLPAFGHIQNDSGIEVKDGKVLYVPVQDGYKEYLKYMNKLFSEKLLDQEIITQTYQQYTAKGKQNMVGIYQSAAPFLFLEMKDPADSVKHPPLPPISSPVYAEKLFQMGSSLNRGTIAITKQNRYPEATMRWIDYLYTDEGFLLGGYGKSLEWKDGKYKYVWEGDEPEKYRAAQAPTSVTPLYYGEEILGKEDVPAFLPYLNETAKLYEPYAKIPFPVVHFTVEEENEIKKIAVDLQTYSDQMEAKFIVGAESFDKWDSYVGTLKKMNIDKLIDIHQKAYDRWNQSK